MISIEKKEIEALRWCLKVSAGDERYSKTSWELADRIVSLMEDEYNPELVLRVIAVAEQTTFKRHLRDAVGSIQAAMKQLTVGNEGHGWASMVLENCCTLLLNIRVRI